MSLREIAQEVEGPLAGRTISAVLRQIAGLSHSMAKGLVQQGLVRLNGRVLKDPARRLTSGDRIETCFDADTRYHPRAGRRHAPRHRGFSILMEDDDLVVVDKEAGLITVPAPSHPVDSLADRLVAMYAARGFRTPKLWVVHRIDRFTSGLVLFARSARAARALVEQFEKRKARREYLAICEGIPEPAERRLMSWLEERPKSLKVVETKNRTRARRASLSFRTEEVLENAALLRVTLETGRRNQIRVQLAGIKHPLVGDRAYGDPSPYIHRVALHAARLGFLHPRTGKPVRLESPLPEDMTRLLRRFRAERPAAT